MTHELRLYGNLVDRTWKLDLEPAPEPVEGHDWPWALLWTVQVPDGTPLDNVSVDEEQ